MTLHPADQETAKALFLDQLMQHYGITNGTYTGLWQRYCQDLATQSRNTWASGGSIALISHEGKVRCLHTLDPNGRQ